jgi:hypothetical protein
MKWIYEITSYFCFFLEFSTLPRSTLSIKSSPTIQIPPDHSVKREAMTKNDMVCPISSHEPEQYYIRTEPSKWREVKLTGIGNIEEEH